MPSKSYADQIIADIRAQIEDGRLQSGDRLPSYAGLAEQYRCSVQPVKNAIRSLQAMGLVEGHVGKGVYVRGAPTGG